MKKIYNFYKIKNLMNCLLKLLIFFSSSIYINSQNITSIQPTLNLDYDGVLGVGWGVFSIIISFLIGLCCCIYGFSTIYSL